MKPKGELLELCDKFRDVEKPYLINYREFIMHVRGDDPAEKTAMSQTTRFIDQEFIILDGQKVPPNKVN